MKLNKKLSVSIILGLFSYNVAATGGLNYDMNKGGGRAHPSVMFVVDLSGSMSGSPLDGAKSTIERAVNKMRPSAYLGLISFSGCAHEDIVTEVPLAFGTHDQIINKSRRFSASGSTNIYWALKHAKEQMKNVPNSTCTKVIILTDGSDSCGEGDVAAISKEVVGANVCNSVNIISLGLEEYEAEVMDDIAAAGNGDHTEVGDSSEVDQVVDQILEQGNNNASGTWAGDYSGTDDTGSGGKKRRKPNTGSGDKPKDDGPQSLEQGQGQAKSKTRGSGNNDND